MSINECFKITLKNAKPELSLEIFQWEAVPNGWTRTAISVTC